MCIKPDTSAQKEAVRLQRQQALVAAEAEDDARAADKAATLDKRRAARRGRSVQSLAILNTTPGGGARSLFQPTGSV